MANEVDGLNIKGEPRRGTQHGDALPPPDAEALAHSERLITHIRQAMAEAGGSIDFARFMQLALYAPGLGYYSAGSRKFGAEGDFVTAPELSALFSRSLARQCAEVLGRLGGGEILEFGAGSGVMAADILAELEQLGSLPARYAILEVSAELRARQQETLARKVPHLAARVVWLDVLPASGFVGVVLANEVLDAMPVHRFRIVDGEPRELCVVWAGGRFALEARPAPAPLYAKLKALQQEYALTDGYESELNLFAIDWVRELGGFLARGVVLLIDYGFPRAEFYHPQRSGGTLMCHYRHRAHDDALILPGLQDITAHVDFTAVAEAALAAGLSVSGFANQANFLIGCGLTELLAEEEGDVAAQYNRATAVKRLTLPGQMGEIFKVMALSREVAGPWRGFLLRDERGRL